MKGSIINESSSQNSTQGNGERLNVELDGRETAVEVEVTDNEAESNIPVGVAIELARVRLLEANRFAFFEACKDLLKILPQLQSFGWDQFWGDCDGCGGHNFDVNFDDPHINGIDGTDLREGGENNPEAELQAQVAAFLQVFDASDMEALFGEVDEVTVYRDGRVGTMRF